MFLVIICPHCDGDNPTSANYCNHCGNFLEPIESFKPRIAPASAPTRSQRKRKRLILTGVTLVVLLAASGLFLYLIR